MLKLEHFLYVIEVHKAKSISKAAENLLVSQPYLSTLIKEIEQTIGVPLFKRHSRGVTLTGEGELFLTEARIIEQALHAVQQLSKLSTQQPNHLSIASIYSYTMLDLYYEFVKTPGHENHAITYVETQNQLILDQVAQGEVDLGILYMDTHTLEKLEPHLRTLYPNLILEIYHTESVTIAVSSQHPLFTRSSVTLEELKSFELLIEPYKLKLPIIADLVKGIPLEPSEFDNNRSLLFYLTKSDRCFTLGQGSLNTRNPFVVSGQLAYIPVTNVPYRIHIGCLFNEIHRNHPIATAYRALIQDYFKAFRKECPQ